MTFDVVDSFNDAAGLDLTLAVNRTATGLEARFEHRTDVLDPGLVARMAEQFRVLLNGIVRDPESPISELPLLTETESGVTHRTPTTGLLPSPPVHRLVEQQAAERPLAPAIVWDGGQLVVRYPDSSPVELLVQQPDQLGSVRTDRRSDRGWVSGVHRVGGHWGVAGGSRAFLRVATAAMTVPVPCSWLRVLGSSTALGSPSAPCSSKVSPSSSRSSSPRNSTGGGGTSSPRKVIWHARQSNRNDGGLG